MCACVRERVRLSQYGAGRQAVSQDIIMTARHQNSFIVSRRRAGKSPRLTGNSVSQQRSTKGPRCTATVVFPLSSPPFFCLFVCFTMECENAIITAVSDRGRQFGRGEGRHCPWHVYGELCQAMAGGNDGAKGQRVERRDGEARGGSSRGKKIARARD